MQWSFEEFELDAKAFELRQGGEPVPAEPQVLALLILLVENHGRLLKKDEIVDAIWDGRAISDAALSSRVKSARQLIGDNGRDQRLIKTIYGNGFRFVGQVDESGTADAVTPDKPVVASSARGQRRWWPAGLVVLLLGALALSWTLAGSSGSLSEDDVRIAVLPFASNDDGVEGQEIASAIVSRLSDRRDFTMLSSTSSFSLAGQGLTAKEISENLDASHLIEGEVIRDGGRFAVDLRLVEGQTQRQIWSRTVEGDVDEEAQVITEAIRGSAAAIQAYLGIGGGFAHVPDGTPPEAVRDFARAMELELSLVNATTRLSQHQLLEGARTAAPDWAAAHGAYAWSTLYVSPDRVALTSEEQHEMVQAAIARGKELDPDDRWVRLVDGVYETRYGTDLANAIAMMEALVEDEPDWKMARRMYAQALVVGGQYREAAAQYEKIDTLNDLNLRIDGFVRTNALRGLGQNGNIEGYARACQEQCFWLYDGWFEGLLVKEYETRDDFERDLDDFLEAFRTAGIEAEAREMKVGENLPRKMTATARFLKGYGSATEDIYGLFPVWMIIAHRNGDVDTAVSYLGSATRTIMPSNASIQLLYDDALAMPDAIRRHPGYHEFFASPNMQAVLDYRAERGMTAGSPLPN